MSRKEQVKLSFTIIRDKRHSSDKASTHTIMDLKSELDKVETMV